MYIIDDIVKKVTEFYFKISIFLLFLLLGLNTVEIINRYFLNDSFTWAQEVSLLLLCWSVFLGFAKVVTSKEDIAVTMLIDRIKEKNKKWIVFLHDILISIASIVIFYYTISLMTQQFIRTTEIAGFSESLYTIPLALGILIIGIYTINNCVLFLVQNFRNK